MTYPSPSERRYEATTAVGKQFVTDLRMFMRDTAKFNDLLDEEEVGDDVLVQATIMMINDFQSTTPLIFSTSDLEFILNNHLVTAALHISAAHVLMMKAQQQERNFLQYSDGGRTETINDKAQTYKETIQILRNFGYNVFKEFKLASNLVRGYGGSGVFSDYFYLNDGI